MKKWEYKIWNNVSVTEEDLNLTGSEGWELINVNGIMFPSNRISGITFIFKREIPNESSCNTTEIIVGDISS